MNEEADYDDYLEDEDDESVEYYAVRPNKTQIKREIAAVLAMVEEICLLSASHITEFELPERIDQAVRDAAKMGQNAARKRLIKYITAQLRSEDVDLEAVSERLARIKNRSAHAVREHHQAEKWRDQLLADSSNQQLTSFIESYPEADSQYMRQLQRNALKEAKESKPPASARLLYQYIKGVIVAED
jgi:ribosome-associated protein